QGRELLDAAAVMAVMASIVVIGLAVDRVVFRVLEGRVRRRWGLGEPEAA
ncbi:MAG TPA: ABC transporter permease, partial [Anaeromyxobacter sp.]|nr:ABC transporter permease [Anaeromyxobacter sp.]